MTTHAFVELCQLSQTPASLASLRDDVMNALQEANALGVDLFFAANCSRLTFNSVRAVLGQHPTEVVRYETVRSSRGRHDERSGGCNSARISVADLCCGRVRDLQALMQFSALNDAGCAGCCGSLVATGLSFCPVSACCTVEESKHDMALPIANSIPSSSQQTSFCAEELEEGETALAIARFFAPSELTDQSIQTVVLDSLRTSTISLNVQLANQHLRAA